MADLAWRTAGWANASRQAGGCCDAKAAMQSLINLGKPPSNTYRGDPFIPRRVIPVDLFPHTPHVEIVIMFERMPLIEMASKEENMA